MSFYYDPKNFLGTYELTPAEQALKEQERADNAKDAWYQASKEKEYYEDISD